MHGRGHGLCQRSGKLRQGSAGAQQVKQVTRLCAEEATPYVGEALRRLRAEVGNQAAVLGFVGAPFTLASYIVEGGSSSKYTHIKRLAFSAPDVLHALLGKLADNIADYVRFQVRRCTASPHRAAFAVSHGCLTFVQAPGPGQGRWTACAAQPPLPAAQSYGAESLCWAAQADAGAQAVQIFDSWASELAPQDFDVFAGPYIRRVVDSVRGSHPDLQLILYISGSGGLMERMAGAGVDVISVDHRVDLRDALQRIGPDLAVQVNNMLGNRVCTASVPHA